MKIPVVHIVCWVLCAGAVLAAPVYGQNQTLSVFAESGLDFGMVYAGSPTGVTMDIDDPGAAMFRIVGPRNTRVVVSFILPPYLHQQGGGATVPLAFDGQVAAWAVRKGNSAIEKIRFNPVTGMPNPEKLQPPDDSMMVWLGGSVQIPTNQPAGFYSGTIIITVESPDI
jgi:hypothetical protein